MRFARKLALVLWIGICVVYGFNAVDRYRRETALFETDIRRDHAVMGRGLVGAVAELWQDEGQARALEIVERANARENDMLIRWVDLAAAAPVGQRPSAPATALTGVAHGEVQSWIDETGGGRLYTYVPVRVHDRWTGAIELSETLEPARAYLAASLRRMLLTFGSLALVTGSIAMALGVWFVGRPIRLLVEKARRVGAGDFQGDLQLSQEDELGELAREMNTMAARLAAARAAIEAESAARTTALDQLRHAERLNTVGKLAAGVAHELGTPLNVIELRAGAIAAGELTEEESRHSAAVIGEQVARITRIVRQLLDFARRRTPDRARTDLSRMAESTLTLLRPLARRANVEVELRSSARALQGEGHLYADVDAVQLQQVMTNLVVNGIQAMPEGGRLTLGLDEIEAVPPPDVGVQRRSCVRIWVEDTGHGMDEATLSLAFDPFFTTKAVGEGTGLGLPVAYGIVREHGGWIRAESTPGKGTRFEIYLPKATS